MMKLKFGIMVFSLVEILIGLVTLAAVMLSLIQGQSRKPLEVLVFVLITAATSMALGFGIFRRNLTCYHLLLYFSSIIILSKLLIFTKIIALNGSLETSVPSSIKNTISIFYHSLVIFYFTRKPVKKQFAK